MNNVQLKAEVAKLLAENEALKASKSAPRTLTFKVGQKRGVSVYGFGRFPVTLYKAQWYRFEERFEELMAFVRDADAKGLLANQGDPVPEDTEQREDTGMPINKMAARQAQAIKDIIAEDDIAELKAKLADLQHANNS